MILTLNEERDIARALRSVSACDEIFIVDSGSSDGTLAAARSTGVPFTWVTHRQEGDYRAADQRNWALDSLPLRNNWVLFLDADECATKNFIEAANATIKVADSSEITVILCAPKFLYHGKWLKYTKSFPTWEPRLLNRQRARLEPGTWERVPVGTATMSLPVPYEHYANSKGLDPWVAKHLQYARWEADRASGMAHEQSVAPARRIAELAGWVRPVLVYLWFLVVRRAFLDGRAGWSYARRMFIYELLIRERIIEQRAVMRGVPL